MAAGRQGAAGVAQGSLAAGAERHQLRLDSPPLGVGDRAAGQQERLERVILVAAPAGELTGERLRTLLADWWCMGEGHSICGTGRLVKLFQDAGFVTDTAGVGPPAGELTVYRGVTAGGNRRRLSWTLEPDIAAWYARRYALIHGRGAVLAAEVSPRHVLGIFHGRQEAEAVVNFRGLRNIREVERVGPPS